MTERPGRERDSETRWTTALWLAAFAALITATAERNRRLSQGPEKSRYVERIWKWEETRTNELARERRQSRKPEGTGKSKSP